MGFRRASPHRGAGTLLVLVQGYEEMRASESLVREHAVILPALLGQALGNVLVNPEQIDNYVLEPVAQTARIPAVVLVKDAGQALRSEDVGIGERLVFRLDISGNKIAARLGIVILDKCDSVERVRAGQPRVIEIGRVKSGVVRHGQQGKIKGKV